MINNQVLWGEGLFLRPQHFQVQDNYHNMQRAHSMQLTHPYLYGVVDVRIDEQLLDSGMLSFQHIQAVLPDGTLYRAPYTDVLPKSLTLDIKDNRDDIFVFLQLDMLHHSGQNIKDDSKDSARYVRTSNETQDLYSQAADAVIDTIQLSPQIQLSHSSSPTHDDNAVILLAKLTRTTQGGYTLDNDYVVPSLQVQSNASLLNQLHRLITMISTKSSSLYDHHRQSNSDLLEFRSSDIASFWLLHTLNTACAQLNHIYHHPKLHPERLFEAFLSVASQLATFSTLYKVSDLPNYRHDNVNESFSSIINIIRELLNTVIASNFISITLRQTKPSYYLGDLNTDKITRSSQLYLSVSSSLPMHELVDLVPRRFKIGAPDAVEKRVLAALPGCSISHVSQVPSAIPVRPGFAYFMIEQVGEMYDEMMKLESICVYVPNGFDDLKIELMAIA